MSNHLKAYSPPEEPAGPPRRRPLWRQRLVEAERGMTLGIRSDSALFFHFFLSSVVIAAGFVLSISINQWAVVILALTLVLSAEMFNQVLKELVQITGHPFQEPMRKLLHIATAAVFVCMAGTLIALLLIFVPRIAAMFRDA